jgi:hypothetical protein
MCVPDKRQLGPVLTQYFECLLAREDVLPDRVEWACMGKGDRPVRVTRFQHSELGDKAPGEVFTGPGERGMGVSGETVERNGSCDREVVVAGKAAFGSRHTRSDAEIGIGAVADEIAEAPDPIDTRASDPPEHSFEGVTVAVDITDHRDLSRFEYLDRSLN